MSWATMLTMGEGRTSFDAVAAVYHAVRPTYPPALFTALFELLPGSPHIVEVGAGTGLATCDLIERGASVHAIEIGPSMAATLSEHLASAIEDGRLHVTVGDFEVVDIAPRSADAVFAATAYHWVSAEAQTDRPATILRRGGLVAIVDLIQVDSPDDRGFFAAAQPIYDRYGQGHAGPPAPLRHDAVPPMRDRLAADGRFDTVELQRYDWNQTYSAARYRQLMMSYSGTQMMPPRDREGLLDDMEALVHERFDGHVTRPLVATLTTARLARAAIS